MWKYRSRQLPRSAPDPTEPKRDDADIVLPSVDFETLRENGPDIIGWLSLTDTVLNYPVTQTDNNEYYLNHLYDETKDCRPYRTEVQLLQVAAVLKRSIETLEKNLS